MSADVFTQGGAVIQLADALEVCRGWPTPTCIVSDGPYGVSGFPGDPPSVDSLPEWYAPHIEAWSERATPQTTLWFWNTELGWATVHPVLKSLGWEYRACHVWNKGAGHVAGNANSRTLRKFPVVTEVCAQYVKPARFSVAGRSVSMRDWLRGEWARSGLPMRLANDACGVRSAATRKYLTRDSLWYFPPVEMFLAMARYANEHGDPAGRPYFSVDGMAPIAPEQWGRQRAKFRCEVGVHNVWNEPAVRGPERIKRRGGGGCLHANQKPLRLMEIIIRACTDEGDVVWEPFGGLCSAAVAARRLGRRSRSAEVRSEFFEAACRRLAHCGNGAERATLFGVAS